MSRRTILPLILLAAIGTAPRSDRVAFADDAANRPNGAASGPAGVPIAAGIETPYLGFTFSYYGPANGSRFLAARLVVLNSGSETVVIPAREIALRVEGTDLRMKEVANGLRNLTIQAGSQLLELSKIKPLADLSVAPGATAEKWLVFTGITPGIHIPTMVVHFPIAGKEFEINVNEAARRAMKLR